MELCILGIRPVICINEKYGLEWNSTNEYYNIVSLISETTEKVISNIGDSTWEKKRDIEITINDENGLADNATLEYMWTTSESEEEPLTSTANWEEVTLSSYSSNNTSKTAIISKDDISGNNWYLWIKPNVTDMSGNTNTAAIRTGPWYFDNIAPTAGTMKFTLGSVDGDEYTAGDWTNQDVYLTLTNGTDETGGSGHKSTTYTIDGKTSTDTVITEEGEHEIIVTTKDNAGNSAERIYTIKIDKKIGISDVITSETLTVEEDKLLIRDINPKTTAEDLIENLVIEPEMNYEIINTNGKTVTDTSIVGTGYKIKMETGKEYTLIVRGDINGDGQIKLVDLARISRIYVTSNANPSDLEKLAIDVNKNGKIELNDITVISRLRIVE